MKSSGLSLAIAVAAIYAAFAGFFFVKAADEASVPGADRVLVSGEAVTTGGDGLANVVQRAAASADAVVLREVRDLNSSAVRHLYLAVGDPGLPEAQWLSDGYPSFSTAVRTAVHPAADLEGADPRGRYYVLGPSGAASSVAASFADLGYEARTEPGTTSTGMGLSWLLSGPFGTSTLVTLLLATLLAGISVVTGIKSYAVQRLHGARRRTAILRDFRRVSLPALLLVAAVGTCGAAALWFYNGLNQVGTVLQIAGTVFLAALALVVGIHVAAVHAVWGTRLVEGIKGRLGFRIAVPAAYCIRVPGLLLAVSVVASTFAAAGLALDAGHAREDLNAAGTAAQIRFEAVVPPDEMNRLAYESGAWLRQEDAAGRTILAAPLASDGSSTASSPDVLMVNTTYLELNEVLDADGNRVLGTAPGTVKVLVPTGSPTTSADVVSLLNTTSAGGPDTVETQQIKSGQSHFLYEPHPDSQQRPTRVENSVVVVVTPGSGVIRDDDYMAYASRGRVLMTDPAVAVRNTPPELLGPWISAYVPVAQAAADEYAAQVTTLRVQAASAVVALGVLLATAVGLAQIHVRGNAQSILVRHLHGWGFLRTHRWLFAAEAALVGVVSCWAAVRAAAALAAPESDAGSGLSRDADLAVATWQPWALVIVAVLNLGLLVALVYLRSRSMIRTHSEETA